ncbi:adhesion G protein-coupled receptor L4-like [Sycon ciliatum]|uniref:adhesion G protein-coupled receptor L4-like n=1 Tax=Sycon ciliatum TaxID=27933 RepID=UPI0031F6C5B4
MSPSGFHQMPAMTHIGTILIVCVHLAWPGAAQRSGPLGDLDPDVSSSLPAACSMCNCTGGRVDCQQLNLSSFPTSSLPTSITEILLSRNRLRTLAATSFYRFSDLTDLFLDNNHLSNLPSGLFNQLKNLEILNLASNRLRALPGRIFSGMERLTDLYLDSNQIFFVSPTAFYGLHSLEKLSLRNNSLTRLEPDVFAVLTPETVLIINENNVRGENACPITTVASSNLQADATAIEARGNMLSQCGTAALTCFKLNQETRFDCRCPQGTAFFNHSCNDNSTCSSQLGNCSNFIQCVTTGISSRLKCTCPEGTEIRPSLQSDIASPECIVACNSTEVRDEPGQCVCADGYAGDECDDIDECDNSTQSLCPPEQLCTNTIGSYQCTCRRRNFSNESLCLGVCASDTTSGQAGTLNWDQTFEGETLTIPCPSVPDMNASRRCVLSEDNASRSSAMWGAVDSSQCLSDPEYDISDLLSISISTDDPGQILFLSESLRDVTGNVSTLTRDNFIQISGFMERMMMAVVQGTFPSNDKTQISKSIVGTVSNVLNAPMEAFATQGAERITLSMETLVTSLSISADESIEAIEENVGFVVTCPDAVKENGPGVVNQTDGSRRFGVDLARLGSIGHDLKFKLPSDLLAAEGMPPDQGRPVDSCASRALQLIVYRQTSLFQDSRYQAILGGENGSVSRIVSAQMGNTSLHNLSSPVSISFDINNTFLPSANVKCVSWDYSLGGWSEYGCSLREVVNGSATCECNHLTHFAILVTRAHLADTIPAAILTYVSYIGCGLSILGVTATLVTILAIRKLRTKAHQKMVFGLCISLLAVLILFLFAEQVVSDTIICKGIAMGLHYFLLSAFCFAAADATYLHRQIVRVIAISKGVFTVKRSLLFALGVPLVIVGATAGATGTSVYGRGTDMNFCWIHSRVYFFGTFIGPLVLIMLYNATILATVTRALMGGKGKVASMKKAKRNDGVRMARVVLSLSMLLGLTWISAFVMLLTNSIVVQYVFTIFNTLQGFAIFVHTILDKDVRKGWSDVLLQRRKSTSVRGALYYTSHVNRQVDMFETRTTSMHGSRRSTSARSLPERVIIASAAKNNSSISSTVELPVSLKRPASRSDSMGKQEFQPLWEEQIQGFSPPHYHGGLAKPQSSQSPLSYAAGKSSYSFVSSPWRSILEPYQEKKSPLALDPDTYQISPEHHKEPSRDRRYSSISITSSV